MPTGRDSLQRERDEAFVAKCNDARARGLTWRLLARELGIQDNMLLKRRREVERRLGCAIPSLSGQKSRDPADPKRPDAPAFEAQPDVSELPTYEEIRDQRLKQTRRKLAAKSANEVVTIKLNIRGPFGVAFIGDPHIDSPGCNLELLLEHTRIIKETPRLFGICVGDIQDNWIGRLARLWSTQGMSAAESQVLTRGWLESFGEKLLALSYGNHDVWTADQGGGHPLDWIRGRFGTVARNHGVRLRLVTLDGFTVTVNLRHDFPGRSQYNPAHGPAKSMLFGFRDDIAVAGHTHEFGALHTLDPATRRGLHAVRLGSYKHADEYADQNGMLDRNLTECETLVADPLNPDRRHRTHTMHSVYRAAQHIQMLVAEFEAVKGKRKRS